MKVRLFTIIFMCCLLGSAKSESYPEVVFDNSLVKGSYARSFVDYSGHSWVENVHRNLLVSDTLFFTPGNALSLRYISSQSGDWNAIIKYSRQKFHYRVSHDDVLNLKIFVSTAETTKDQLPSISIQQGPNQSVSLPLGDYIEDLNNSNWLNVSIPVREFAGLNTDKIISGIILRQNNSSEVIHHVFLDQIEFLPTKYSNAALTSSAVLSKAVSYGQHIDLHWQVPLTPSIRYVKVYRSENNKDFKAVAVRPTYMLGCLDFVPQLDKKYYYKIAWVDYDYRESPFSDVKEVDAKPMDDDQLIDFIQYAHINYFVENYDINSGMYMPFRMKDKALVSVQESGGALLSLLIGVEKGYVSKALFLNRVNRIVSFLDKAQNNKGFFAEYFDGRKGLPEYLGQQPKYDVNATSSIIESLLIVRQYLTGDDPLENKLRGDITKIWDRIDWKGITMESDSLALRPSIDMVDEYSQVQPLSGLNLSLNAYMLAIASTKSSIPPAAFINALNRENVLNNKSDRKDTLKIDSVKFESQVSALRSETHPDSQMVITPIQDTVMYGIKVPFGNITSSLLDIYRPFITINPSKAIIGDYNLGQIVYNYTQIVKRRDNEIGVGTTSSDIWGFYQHYDSVGNYQINPAIAISSIFLDKVQAKKSILSIYREYGEYMFTEYGFRAWMDLKVDDVAEEYIAKNQASVVVMLENAKTGLIWKLYQEIPEIKSAQQRIFRK